MYPRPSPKPESNGSSAWTVQKYAIILKKNFWCFFYHKHKYDKNRLSLKSEPWGAFSLHVGGAEAGKGWGLHKNRALGRGRKG